MRSRQFVLLTVAGVLVGPAVYSLTHVNSSDQAKDYLTLVSEPYRLDRIYRSMEGPMSIQDGISLPAEHNSPVEWITGVETEVVDAADQKPISQEFFCHSNLTFAEHSGTPRQVNQQLGGRTHLDWRLFTLVPGRLAIELPPGFGVPVPTHASLDYVTMSLNLTPRNEVVNVRMRTKVHTVAAGQPGAPSKALFRRALYVLQPHDESGGNMSMCMASSPMQHMGAACAEFKPGGGLTNHWIVPRGRHVYKTEITPQMNIPFDTTIHYATIHVHPFARGMQLRDLTTGETILTLGSRDWTDRIGVAHVDEFKSISGIPIFRDHRYEVTAEYDNTSGSNTDAMAILYLYLLEKDLT